MRGIHVRNYSSFIWKFSVLNILILELFFIFLVMHVRNLLREGLVTEAILWTVITASSLGLYIQSVRAEAKDKRLASHNRLNAMQRLNLYYGKRQSVTALGILNKEEPKFTMEHVIKALDKKLEAKYNKVLAWVGEHERGYVESALLNMEGDTVEFRKILNPDRIPFDQIPIEQTLQRKLSSYFSQHDQKELQEFLVKGNKITDTSDTAILDAFIQLNDEALKQLEAKGMVGNLKEIQSWVEYSVDFFTPDEVMFFKKMQITNVNELRHKIEPALLERLYNKHFLEAQKQKLQALISSPPAPSQPGTQSSQSPAPEPPMKLKNMLHKFVKWVTGKADWDWVYLNQWIENSLVAKVIERESRLLVTFTNEEKYAFLNGYYVKNIVSKYPATHSYTLEFDQWVPFPYITFVNGEKKEETVPVDFVHIITPDSWENTVDMHAEPTPWEGRNSLTCSAIDDLHVYNVLWYKEKEPVLLVIFSDWHRRNSVAKVDQIKLSEVFNEMIRDFVSKVQDLEDSQEELRLENDAKDKQLISNEIDKQKNQVIKDGQEDMAAWQKRFDSDWRVYKIPAGWIIVIACLISMFSVLAYYIGFNIARN